MKKQTKQIPVLVFWLLLLVLILLLPEISAVTAIALLIGFVYKKTKDIPIGKIRRR